MEDLRSTLATYTQPGSNTLFDQLNEIGISTGDPSGSASFSQDSVNGKLVLDTNKLTAALDSDPTAVQNLLGGNLGTPGFSQSFSNVLSNYVQTGGVFDNRIDAASDEIKDFTNNIADMDTRLSQKQQQLQQMFTSMELALNKAKSQGAELLAKLGVSSDGG